jgi:hypothetical protein
MLGYVSSERLTCLLLELADTSLLNAIETMKNEIQENKKSIQDIVKYLIGIAIQIADAMVTTTFYFFFKCKNNCVMKILVTFYEYHTLICRQKAHVYLKVSVIIMQFIVVPR